jgi:hypothetical protein
MFSSPWVLTCCVYIRSTYSQWSGHVFCSNVLCSCAPLVLLILSYVLMFFLFLVAVMFLFSLYSNILCSGASCALSFRPQDVPRDTNPVCFSNSFYDSLSDTSQCLPRFKFWHEHVVNGHKRGGGGVCIEVTPLMKHHKCTKCTQNTLPKKTVTYGHTAWPTVT